MKWVLRVLIIIVVLVVVAAGVAWAMIDTIAKTAVVNGGEYATGTTNTLSNLKLSLLNGELNMDSLVIENVKELGFASPCAFKMGRFAIKLTPSSVLSDTVQLQTFEIDGMEVYLEQKGANNNLSLIIKHLQQIASMGGEANPAASAAPAATSPASPQKPSSRTKIKADHILIKGVVAHVKTPLPGKAGDITIKVPTVELRGLRSADGGGLTVSQIASRILPAVVQSVLENGKGMIPPEMSALLQGDVAAVGDKLVHDAGKVITDKLDANHLADPNALKDLQKTPLKDLPKNPLKLYGGDANK